MKPARWLLVVGFALVILGGKLWLIDTAGSDLPTWDQWDAISESVLRPWLEHRLDLARLVAPHNEHRLVTTKLYTLALFAANGQWSGYVETATNAVVHTLFALTLLAFARRWLAGPALAGFALLLVALFTSPFSWENTLNGFQVQFYFLLLFSFLHLWLALDASEFGARWTLAQLAGLLALASSASGFFSALVLVAFLGVRLLRARGLPAPALATLLLSGGLVAAGLLLRTDVPGHAFLRAENPGRFFTALGELLAWPGPAWLPWTLLPIAAFLWQRCRTRSLRRDDIALLAVFGWLLLQCLALAYARGGGPGVLRSRYLDILSVHVALGYLFLANLTPARLRPRILFLWTLLTVAALAVRGREHARDYFLPDVPHRRAQEANVAAYLRTGDAAMLRAAPADDIPYPDAGALIDRLSSPALRAVLPPSVRPPVALASVPPAPRTLPPALQPARFSVAVSTWTSPAAAPPFAWHSLEGGASALPLLRFRVAGDLDANHPRLQLRVASGAGSVAVLPDARPGERWKSVTIFRPAGAWTVTADDADATSWFAVAEPVELTRGTWLAEKVIKFHLAILGAGLALAFLGAALLRFPVRQRLPR